MKSSFLLKFCSLVCVSLFCVAYSSLLSDKGFTIEGKISDIEDGTVINLYRPDGNVLMVIASDTVRNGCFTFREETISDPEQLSIIPQGDGFPPMFLNVWVASGTKTTIKGKGKIHPVWEVESSIAYQKEENRYKNDNRDLIAESAKISLERNNAFMKIMAVSSREESLPYRKIVDSLDLISGALRIKQIFANINVMEKTDVSPVWLDKMRGAAMELNSKATNEHYDGLRNKVEALYKKMSEEDKNTPLGYHITSRLFPPPVVGVGDDMPDTDFFDINGNTKNLSDYMGKYLLLDFWSSGCGPCIMALPEMKEISETYIEKLTIISISLDTDTRWKAASATHDMPWVNIRDPKAYGGLAANYDVRGIPYYVIISPEGKVVDKWGGYGKGSLKRKVSENIK